MSLTFKQQWAAEINLKLLQLVKMLLTSVVKQKKYTQHYLSMSPIQKPQLHHIKIRISAAYYTVFVWTVITVISKSVSEMLFGYKWGILSIIGG